jgi:hypothetical protein
MTRTQRAIHVYVWLILAPLLAVGILAGLLARAAVEPQPPDARRSPEARP